MVDQADRALSAPDSLGLSHAPDRLPGPIVASQRLSSPIAVTAIGDTLVLANGRRVRLPFIKTIPKDDPVFVRALEHGVEVDEKGEVFGLIEPPRMCGNDPVVFYRKRANLSDLAGILNPGGIDDSIVHPDEVRWLKEDGSRSPSRHGMPYHIMGKLAGMRRIYEHHADRQKDQSLRTQSDDLD